MKLPPHIATCIRTVFEREIKSIPALESPCVHLPTQTVEALEKYLTENPHRSQQISAALLHDDRSILMDTLSMVAANNLNSPCTDVLCLSCRRTRITDCVACSDGTLSEHLDGAAQFLGSEVMESLEWMTETIIDTVHSKRLSKTHYTKAHVALKKTIPIIAISAAMIKSLQKDLAAAIEDMNKYHRLADMLMEQMSAPTSSES